MLKPHLAANVGSNKLSNYNSNKSHILIEINLREILITDLDNYYSWNLPEREFHKLNAPYFEKMTELELRNHVAKIRTELFKGNLESFTNKKIISNAKTNELIGEVSWYWKSQETKWLEIGIVIFNEKYWNKGIGKKALTKWINNIFDINLDLVRIGFTTWSGNIGMVKLGESLKFRKEAEYKKARIVNGKYFDSISYGILREEWYTENN